MKRTFSEIRHLLLQELCHGQQTINQLSLKAGVNWRTVQLHLEFLSIKEYVKEVVSSEYVRIFEITPKGKEHAGLESRKKQTTRVEVKLSPSIGLERVEIK